MDTSLFAGIYQELLRAWPNRWLGFFIALIFSAVVAVVVIALPDQYESRSRVFINSETVLKPLLSGLAVEDDSENRARVLRVLQSTLLSPRNVESIITTPGMGFDASTPAARARAAAIVTAGVTIEEEQDNLFSIKNVDTNPTRSRNVVHGLLSLFIQTNIVQTQTDLRIAGEFLDKQIAEYQAKLREMEAQISAFRNENSDVLGEPPFQTRLSVARTALRDALLQRQLAVQTRDRIAAQIKNPTPREPGASPILLATDQTFPALIDRITALQQQLNQLLLQYTERHPDVIATRREIALITQQFGLEERIASATQPLQSIPGQVPVAPAVSAAVDAPSGAPGAATSGPVAIQPVAQAGPAATPLGISSMQLQYMQANFAVIDADRKVAAAEAAFKLLDRDAPRSPPADAGLDQLTRDYALLKENYDQLMRRRESARMTSAANDSAGTEQFRVIQEAAVPSSPTGPDRRTYLMLGALLSVAGGVGLAYALGLLRGTFVSATEAEQILGLPVIARLSNTHGVLARVSQSADALMLMAGVAGVFVAAYVLSAATGLLVPLRTEIYRFIEVYVSKLLF